jgi:hypothetical protein
MSLLVGEVGLARWAVEDSRLLGVLVLAVAVPGTTYVLSRLGRRQRQTLAALRAGRPLRDGGRLTGVLTAVVVATGVLEVLHLLLT